MGCFSCFAPLRRETSVRIEDTNAAQSNSQFVSKFTAHEERKKMSSPHSDSKSCVQSFTFLDILNATTNFKEANLIGEGGFGKVYKGKLETQQIVAIKQLNREGVQGSNEFVVEILMLSLLQHPNLIHLIGYCAQGDQMIIVYEFMPQGSLEDHLFDLSPNKQPLDWNTRVKIALGAAKGLTYLHDDADPPVIYRDMKAGNILLDNEFNPKLSDFGLAKFGPVGDHTHVSTRVMGTYGYCAPEYAMSGKLTKMSDVYSFGVVLLELITGRRAFDASKTGVDQNLFTWARPFLSETNKFGQLADPSLKGCYPARAFNQFVTITLRCLQEHPYARPMIDDVVAALNHVASQPYVAEVVPIINNSSQQSSPSVELSNKRSRGHKARKHHA